MQILMIEDNKSVSDMMGMFFKKEKWKVTFAYDGVKALEIFKADPQQWDIVLLDLNLPGKMEWKWRPNYGELHIRCR